MEVDEEDADSPAVSSDPPSEDDTYRLNEFIMCVLCAHCLSNY